MKKLLYTAIAAVAFTVLAGVGSTVSANAADYNFVNDKDCDFTMIQPDRGTPITDAKGPKKFTRDGNRVYIKVRTEGKNCKQPVSLVTWKADSLVGIPYRQQVMVRHNTRTLTGGTTVTMSIAVPANDCFYQIDLVRGFKGEGKFDGGAYEKGRMIYSVHGGTKTIAQCTPVTEEPETPVEEPDTTVTEVVTPVTQAPSAVPASTLVKTGPASVAAIFGAVVVVATAGYSLFVRRRNA